MRSLILAVALLLSLPILADVRVAPRVNGPSAGPNDSPRLIADGAEVVVLWNARDAVRFVRLRNSDEIVLTGELAQPGRIAAAVAGTNGSVIVALNHGDAVVIANIARDGEVHVTEHAGSALSSMAWNGTALLIVTRTGRTLLTDERGRLLGHGAQLPLPAEGESSAAARGSDFVVAWMESYAIRIRTLTSGGDVSAEQVVPDRWAYQVVVGCGGAGECLFLTAIGSPLHGQFAGATAGPAFRISEETIADPPAPLWDGRRFLVAWSESTFGERSMHSAVHVAGVELDGTVTPLATIAAPDRNRDLPAIAQANGEVIVAWNDSLRCEFAGGQIVVRSLTTGRELRLTHGLSEQSEPAIAAGSATALVAWTERGGDARIRARRLPFTAPAFEISSGPASGTPVLASDGTGYLAAWRELASEDDCRGRLLISAVGSGTSFTAGRDPDAIQIRWNGSEYVVLWEQANPAQLFAMRVDRSGQPIDPAPVPLTEPEAEPAFTSIDHEPAGLFWTGDGYLLVWRRSRTAYIPWYPDPPPQFEIRTMVLRRDLVPSEAPRNAGPFWSVVATMKDGTIVALWNKYDDTLHAIRLAPDGTLLEDRELGINAVPLQIVSTRSGYAVRTYDEILFLSDSLSLTGRRATPAPSTSIADTNAGLVAVYALDGDVFFSGPGRRRSVR